MININLISPTYKETIKTKQIFVFIRNIVLYIAIFVSILAISLIYANKVMLDNLTQTIGRTTLISRTPREGQKIITTNKKIKLADEIQRDYIAWSRFIIFFSKLTPNNIEIRSLTISPTKNNNLWDISITGMAPKRNDFIQFKEKLMLTDELSGNIDIPISNLFKKENIEFNITLNTKKENLTNLTLEQ